MIVSRYNVGTFYICIASNKLDLFEVTRSIRIFSYKTLNLIKMKKSFF
jgi:hypothetical protein